MRALDLRERRDLLPLRREHPQRGRLRVPDARRLDQRPAHGTAHHDRRREARVGEAHHRGVPVLRIRAPGPQSGRPRTDHGASRRRPAHCRGRGPRRNRRPAHRTDPGLLRLPRRPPHRRAGDRRVPEAQRRERRGDRRPRRGRRQARRGASPTGSTPTSRSSTSAARRARTTSRSPPRSSATSKGARASSSTT